MSTDGAPLLEAILAAPADLAPRLAYATWLTERGDPRGELIALQCGERGGRDEEAAFLREQGLLQRHGSAWLAELGLEARWTSTNPGISYGESKWARRIELTG